jgi:hypothetical protein
VPMSGVHAAAAPASPVPVQPAAPQGSSGVKIVLIVVAIVIGLGILGAAGVGFMAWHVARSVRVHGDEKNVKVETPFGTVQTSENAEAVARDLGIDIYPGAHVVSNNAASVKVGGMHTVTVEFVSEDSPDKVADYYNRKFPRAMVSTKEEGHTTIVSVENKRMTTLDIKPEDGKTRVTISNVTGKTSGGSDDSN